jgi:signal peptidase I
MSDDDWIARLREEHDPGRRRFPEETNPSSRSPLTADSRPQSRHSHPPSDPTSDPGNGKLASDGASAPNDDVAGRFRGVTRNRRVQRDAPKEKKHGSLLRELPVLVVVALGLALLIKAFLVQAFFIPSGSMENTLQVGDRVLVNKVVYHLRDIERGDIVVFNGLDSFTPEVPYEEPDNPIARTLRSAAAAFGVAPPGEKDFIKRVIGIPGDQVACCDDQGRVTVNGVPLDEPYVFPGNSASEATFNVTVPDGRLWVMGDHRAASADSRAHLGDPGGGTVPADKVIGRAFVVVWPLTRMATVSIPETFTQPALQAVSATTAALPLVLGSALAVPLVAGHRRWRRRR